MSVLSITRTNPTEHLLSTFEKRLEKHSLFICQKELFNAAKHILNIKGKRIRPLLCLAMGEMFGSDVFHLLPASLSVELYHNSTLIHDDIMDDADIRRGYPSVHFVYGISTAINAGNLLTGLAYQSLSEYDCPLHKTLMETFNEAVIKVIEGQSMDMAFEKRTSVSSEEYLEMITNKTSVLLAASSKMGAQAAGALKSEVEKAYRFGLHLGLSFQIKDDWLDVFGDDQKVGKKQGGDIVRNKKTLLMIEAEKLADSADRQLLSAMLNHDNEVEKVAVVTSIFERSGAKEVVAEKMNEYYEDSLSALDSIHLPDQNKESLRKIAHKVFQRDY